MTSKRYNVTSPRKYQSQGGEKTQWLRIGVAFENDKGGFDIQLDANPLPEQDRKNEGQTIIRLKAFPADQDGNRGGGGSRQSRGDFSDQDYGGKPDDSDLPF